MAFWGSLKFQNFVWNVSSFLESLHDLVMVWLVVIMVVVIMVSLSQFNTPMGVLNLDSETLEKTWTVLPIFILFTIAYPSIHLLCLQDSSTQTPKVSIKMNSNQWNWQSEYLDLMDHLMDMDSLDVVSSYESPIIFSKNMASRVLLTSTDVIHSLGVPSLGVKLDSSPGRISATLVEVYSPGVFLGSCYELCGSGHSAMPVHFLSV